MKREVMPKIVFERLIKHLVSIEEQKERILKDYYSALTTERRSFELFIEDYIKKVEKHISNCQVSATVKEFCPRCIIGSYVEIEDVEYKETEKYHIISPFENNLRDVTQTASYLSPMGRALLFKKPNEEFVVETPAGKFRFRIKSIDMFENDMFENEMPENTSN